MAVQIFYAEGAMMLRSKGSELLIIPQYVSHLQTLKDPKDFVAYFEKTALMNRSARKLFMSWAKKDPQLWNSIYKTVHTNANKEESSDKMELADTKTDQKDGVEEA